MTDPDTIQSAVINHIENAPTDDDVFDGVPDVPLADVPTAPMVRPTDAPANPFAGDEDWEEDAETVVRKVPEFRKPHDPTGCMM